MTIELEIILQADRVSPAVYASFLQLCPEELRNPYSVRLLLPETDPRATEALTVFGKHQLQRHQGGRLEPNSFELYRYRRYDEPDLNAVKYLQMYNTRLILQDQNRDFSGRLLLPARRLEKPFDMGCVLFQATVVHSTIKDRLQESGMKGLEFKPIVATINGTSEIEPNYWELTSSVRLPPHAFPNQLVCVNSTPFHGDYSKVVGIKQDCRPPELNYFQSALSTIAPFDLALTFEKFPQEHWVVASQRFRQFCLQQKLKLEWIPVRIVGDDISPAA